jgi:hypothetical protein
MGIWERGFAILGRVGGAPEEVEAPAVASAERRKEALRQRS